MKTLLWLTLIVAAAAGGWFLGQRQPSPTMDTAPAVGETAMEHAAKHLDSKYVCPMHPQIVRDAPGTCPICGMVLVPVKAETETGGGIEVKISPEVVNNLGVRTAAAERRRLWRYMDTVGYVDYDESRLAHVHLRTNGWIEKLYVKALGDPVTKGAPLFELYSPDLVNAQQEFLQALGTGNQGLISASRERLSALGVSKRQIDALAKNREVRQRVTVFAPQDGVVVALNVREGMYMQLSKEIVSLADLSSVWVMAELFEQQAGWVEPGQSADVKLSFLPGRTWEGAVEYVYPKLEAKTRTQRVRLRFDNRDLALKPNMYADVTIYGGPKKGVLAIPREALIRTGQGERVILGLGEGRYAPREVVAGMESGGYVEIESGLQAGDKVVTSGQFLIDSEASLKASLARMGGGAVQSPAPVKAATGQGVLKALMPGEGKLNMDHDPIPGLGWPSMTMDFDLAPGVSLQGFTAGDTVEFDLSDKKDGYRVLALRQIRKGRVEP